jgi:hypothetical protein
MSDNLGPQLGRSRHDSQVDISARDTGGLPGTPLKLCHPAAGSAGEGSPGTRCAVAERGLHQPMSQATY